MKFSTSFSSLLVVLPLLLQAAALPNGFGGKFGGAGRGNQGGRFGGNNQNQNQNQKGATSQGNGNNNANNAANSANNTANATSAANNTANAASAANNNNSNNANSANNANSDSNPQTSLTLDPSLVGSNIAQTGLSGNGSEAGEVASLTSTNNFINFCLNSPPITNGIQITSGSCNPIPMGQIPASNKLPACKFSNPVNGQVIGVNTTFDITMNIQNLNTGNFVNADTNFLGAPQQVDSSGLIIGHSHVVIQPIPSLTSTSVESAINFVFFKGLNSAAVNGVLSTPVQGGLDAGTYKLCSINTAANHQPALASIAQHASLDDCVYFTVSNSGAAGSGQDVFGNGGAAAAGGANGAAAAGGANNATAATGGDNNAAAGANGAAAGGAKGAAAGGANNANAAKGGANNANAKGANNAGNKANGQKAAGGAKQQQGKGRRSFTISRQN